jgi:hypothetical protein
MLMTVEPMATRVTPASIVTRWFLRSLCHSRGGSIRLDALRSKSRFAGIQQMRSWGLRPVSANLFRMFFVNSRKIVILSSRLAEAS